MGTKAIILKARSSGGGLPYDVEFSEQESRLLITCTCQAGISHLLCKHRIEIIAGDRSRLYEEPTDADWRAVRTLVEAYGLIAAIEQIHVAEAAAEQAKERLKTLKQGLGHGLDNGLRASSTIGK